MDSISSATKASMRPFLRRGREIKAWCSWSEHNVCSSWLTRVPDPLTRLGTAPHFRCPTPALLRLILCYLHPDNHTSPALNPPIQCPNCLHQLVLLKISLRLRPIRTRHSHRISSYLPNSPLCKPKETTTGLFKLQNVLTLTYVHGYNIHRSFES
jgi:hypothetical protein